MNPTQVRHSALKAQLIAVTQGQIDRVGLSAVRARDVAAAAECSVGTLYTLFDDLTALVLAVNIKTFQALEAEIEHVISGDSAPLCPEDRLRAMARSYLDFAIAHPMRWRALFELEMSAKTPVPDQYGVAAGRVLSLIAQPLRELAPDAPAERIHTVARGVFSAVHGIVLLGLDSRVTRIPRDELDEMICLTVTAMIAVATR